MLVRVSNKRVNELSGANIGRFTVAFEKLLLGVYMLLYIKQYKYTYQIKWFAVLISQHKKTLQ